MRDSEEILFEEKQYFRQIWLWLILIGISLLLTYELVQQVLMEVNFGSKPASDFLIILFWMIFAVGFPLGFNKAYLRTRVYNDRICIQLFPLHFNEQML